MIHSFELAGITLSDAIKLQLESLENIDSLGSNSGIYLDYTQDLQLNLDKLFKLNSAVSYIDLALNNIINAVFGKKKIRIIAPKYRIIKINQQVELSFKGLLNNQEIELFFRQQPVLKYKLPQTVNFSQLINHVPIINDLELNNTELILTNISYSVEHSKLGVINLNRGLNFIGDIDLKNLHTNYSNFIYKNLAISSLGVTINIDPVGQVSLTGNIPGNFQLFCQQEFKATFNNLLIGLHIADNLEPNFGLTGNLILENYDLTQKKEPKLFLSGNLSLEPESLTAFFSQQSEKSWCNPYGLQGTELRNVRFQGGGTYFPPYFDNFGFFGDLKWHKTDLEVGFLIDTNDPEKLALVLNPKQAVSLIDLWRGPVASFIGKEVDYSIDLVTKALEFLEGLVNLNIEPIDADRDGTLNSLIKYVPFPVTIAGQPILEGLEINGKIHAWGREATLIFQSDKTFKNIGGSLKIVEIDLGFLKIKGTNDDSLDLAIKVTPTEQYLLGDGYVEIFGNEVANVEFKVTPTNATFKNFDLSLANVLSIDVDALNIDTKSGNGSGSGTISVLGNRLVGIRFDVTQNSVNLKNVLLSLAGFLTLSIPNLAVNLTDKSASGTANIIAFNQSLGTGTLSFNTQNLTINNVALNFGNFLKLNVPNFKLDLTNKKLFGLGDIILLGKQFTALGISLNQSGFQATSNLNFGILAFNNATVILSKANNGSINNFASIVGNLKFLGYNFANITASVDSNKLTASGSFNFAGILILKGANNQRKAIITFKKAKNGLYSLSIMGSFYLLSQELTSLSICENILGNLNILGIKIISNTKRTKVI
ncbi:Na-Ca exchanger/integrin-beta4 [Nostoc linckia NIES-25]|nr:Na-Ca exchanger/integrin-beta4 [Nostoc linckia NIES-25]